jgi:SAM-dependent methyltransferase
VSDSWDARYAESDRLWSGRPNAVLVDEVSELAPGTALDLGCGEGADAIWLAGRGWRVTAVDVSRVALGRAAAHAAEAGVADRVEFLHRDLTEAFPPGTFDLVSAQYLHSIGDFPREAVLRRAAAAVAPGGVLLVVGHREFPGHDHDPPIRLPSAAETLADLELAPAQWEVLVGAERIREHPDPDGRPVARADAVVKARRLP